MHTTSTPHSEASVDIREFGIPKGGIPQVSERRLYFQLQVFTDCSRLDDCIRDLSKADFESVLYANLNDPKGIGVLTVVEDPTGLVAQVRQVLNSGAFAGLTRIPELVMTGRTYSTGREPDLLDWLLTKPRKNCLNPAWPWAIWYPLRRKPEFAVLPEAEQGKVLMEHGMLGRTYGQADLAHDVRLACHGLDQNDNEFLIGLIGRELYPLSRIVQEMRKTQQTSKYLQSLGPFFVGKAAWQSPIKNI